MRLTSPVFEPDTAIPVPYTCDGADVSPPLAISDIPSGVTALVLVVDDPDAPRGTWDHWLEYDIPPREHVPEDAGPLGTAGRNSWGTTGYRGPCPPGGMHHFVFTVYALDTPTGLAHGADKATVLRAIEGHVLADARLVGHYGREGA